MHSITQFDKEHIGDILRDERGTEFNWYTCRVLRLCSRADIRNRNLLRVVYPDVVQAYEDWAKIWVQEHAPSSYDGISNAIEHIDRARELHLWPGKPSDGYITAALNSLNGAQSLIIADVPDEARRRAYELHQSRVWHVDRTSREMLNDTPR